MKIIIDAFGGDNAPHEIIKGAVEAVNKKEGFNLVLVGKKDVIENELNKYSFESGRIEILEANDVITNEEEPAMAVRSKTDSTIVKGFKLLKEDEEWNAFISGGSTGAYLVGATLRLGRMEGVNRPALAPILPTIDGGHVVLIDSGANADCKPENLCQFAVMGSVYAESVLGIENPRVALLSNGTEDKKGNALNHEVFPLLRENKNINFIGNLEARDVLFGKCDVIVTDGFSGNVALKSMEGGVSAVMTLLKRDVFKGFLGKLSALLVKKRLYGIKDTMDYNKVGGAVFLGAKKLVIKVHGSSKASSVTAAIFQAKAAIDSKTIEKISQKMKENFI